MNELEFTGDVTMKIEKNTSLLLSDTAISDIFINEYLTEADGDFVKVYLYCLFLEKHNKDISLSIHF